MSEHESLINQVTQKQQQEMQKLAQAAHGRRQSLDAEGYQVRLIKMIKRFESKLDDKHEVGLRLVSFGESITFHLDRIGCCSPAMITFSGVTNDGSPVELIQHVSQISILLMKVDRRDNADGARRPIGFSTHDQD